MLSHNPTRRLLQTIWEQERARILLLAVFFGNVDRQASRVEIDALLQGIFVQLTSILETILDTETPGKLAGMCQDISWKHITEYLCTCYYADHARDPLPELPEEEAFREGGSLVLHPQRSRAIMHTVPLSLLPLEQRLLSYGGTRLVYVGEPHLEELLTRGRMYEGRALVVPGGQPCHCYTNAADLWESHRNSLRLAEGYGLSEDGWWRRHSWLLREHPRPRQRHLVETTVRRVRYYGFPLDEHEAGDFLHNYGSGFPIYEGLDL